MTKKKVLRTTIQKNPTPNMYREIYRDSERIYYKVFCYRFLNKHKLLSSIFTLFFPLAKFKKNCKHQTSYWEGDKRYCIECGKRLD